MYICIHSSVLSLACSTCTAPRERAERTALGVLERRHGSSTYSDRK